jgi:hypothetical protein
VGQGSENEHQVLSSRWVQPCTKFAGYAPCCSCVMLQAWLATGIHGLPHPSQSRLHGAMPSTAHGLQQCHMKEPPGSDMDWVLAKQAQPSAVVPGWINKQILSPCCSLMASGRATPPPAKQNRCSMHRVGDRLLGWQFAPLTNPGAKAPLAGVGGNQHLGACPARRDIRQLLLKALFEGGEQGGTTCTQPGRVTRQDHAVSYRKAVHTAPVDHIHNKSTGATCTAILLTACIAKQVT